MYKKLTESNATEYGVIVMVSALHHYLLKSLPDMQTKDYIPS
jgi:hypothetical protein